jgi:hypothetical protein
MLEFVRWILNSNSLFLNHLTDPFYGIFYKCKRAFRGQVIMHCNTYFSSRLTLTLMHLFPEVSTVHGIAYIFDPRQGGAARMAWLLIVIGFSSIAIHLSVEVNNIPQSIITNNISGPVRIPDCLLIQTQVIHNLNK